MKKLIKAGALLLSAVVAELQSQVDEWWEVKKV